MASHACLYAKHKEFKIGLLLPLVASERARVVTGEVVLKKVQRARARAGALLRQ